WVVVCGDFNDNPTRKRQGAKPADPAILSPLLSVPHLTDVLSLQFPDAKLRWTYYYDKMEQIDYILVSEPLKQRFQSAGVERRGIVDLKKITSATNAGVTVEQQWPEVTKWTNAASDHGAVWAIFNYDAP